MSLLPLKSHVFEAMIMLKSTSVNIQVKDTRLIVALPQALHCSQTRHGRLKSGEDGCGRLAQFAVSAHLTSRPERREYTKYPFDLPGGSRQ
jgi:hypothetical protein